MDGAYSEPQVRDALGLHQTTGKGTVSVPENMRPIEGAPSLTIFKMCFSLTFVLRFCTVFMCSIVNREGYGPGFQWLSQYIK